jgi:cytochrome P450
MARSLPPGPSDPPVWNLVRLSSDPLGFATELGRTYGAISSLEVPGARIWFLNDPELVKELLVVKQRSFLKDGGIRVAKKLLGEGLLSSEGDFHKRQRRLAQPAFHKERIASYGAKMVEWSLRAQERWRSGLTVDAAREMNRLTLGIVGSTLFGTDVDAEASEIGQAITDALEMFSVGRLGFARILERMPFPGTLRLHAARERLDRTVYRMIEERRRSGDDRGDLLSMLILATDSEGDGTGMSDVQLRDEAMTIFLAGHETTANALAWTWYLLSRNPAAEAKLHAEIDAVLGDRPPAMEDVKRLPYAEHVVAESMRLFPPAWGIGRQAAEDVEVAGYQVLAGEACFVSQWVLHRDQRFFPDPLRFDPDRWEPEIAATRPKFAYFPFGAGSRICIGESFAWMEAILILATLAQGWRLRLVPNQRITPQPRITLRPSPGIRMTLERRERELRRAA